MLTLMRKVVAKPLKPLSAAAAAAAWDR